MAEWSPDIKRYPHFDPVLSEASAKNLVTDATYVSKHKFYPFLKYDERWTRFAPAGSAGTVKTRPIRFAARLDSCIFSYYRSLLAPLYEKVLTEKGLDESILAYRRIAKEGGGGKSNIDFAKDAFELIRAHDQCCVITLDISDFFESLDHNAVYDSLVDLLGAKRLPTDYFKVFRAITRYSFVDIKSAYRRLGFYGEKKTPAGKEIEGYLRSKKDIPIQLCSGKDFRLHIAGESGKGSIIKTNTSNKGVPQGAPLSDLIANMYMLHFDYQLLNTLKSIGGSYFRYSDDILLIAPVSVADGKELENWVRSCIPSLAPGLIIKEEKSSLHFIEADGENQRITAVLPLGKSNKKLEYLGFHYDGRRVLIRDKTMSGLYRKVSLLCRAKSHILHKRYRDKSVSDIMSIVNIESIIQVFGPVRDFEDKASDYRNWTFSTYARRARKGMGELGRPIARQTRRLRLVIKKRLEDDLKKLADR